MYLKEEQTIFNQLWIVTFSWQEVQTAFIYFWKHGRKLASASCMESVNRSGQMGISLEHAWFRKTNTIQGQSGPMEMIKDSTEELCIPTQESAWGCSWKCELRKPLHLCLQPWHFPTWRQCHWKRVDSWFTSAWRERTAWIIREFRSDFFGSWPDKRKIFVYIQKFLHWFSAYFLYKPRWVFESGVSTSLCNGNPVATANRRLLQR